MDEVRFERNGTEIHMRKYWISCRFPVISCRQAPATTGVQLFVHPSRRWVVPRFSAAFTIPLP